MSIADIYVLLQLFFLYIYDGLSTTPMSVPTEITLRPSMYRIRRVDSNIVYVHIYSSRITDDRHWKRNQIFCDMHTYVSYWIEYKGGIRWISNELRRGSRDRPNNRAVCFHRVVFPRIGQVSRRSVIFRFLSPRHLRQCRKHHTDIHTQWLRVGKRFQVGGSIYWIKKYVALDFRVIASGYIYGECCCCWWWWYGHGRMVDRITTIVSPFLLYISQKDNPALMDYIGPAIKKNPKNKSRLYSIVC